MGESLHCDVCGKPATVHLTQIVKNQFQKVDLCEACAQAKGMTDPESFSLAELLAKSFAGAAEDEGDAGEASGLVCEQCGYTPRDLKRTGRLGCAVCYTGLGPVVRPLLAGLYHDNKHRGKIPLNQWRVELRREMASLEQQMLEAKQAEDFETAARCRDRLTELRARLEAPAAPN